MNVSRFILLNAAARITGLKIPPYLPKPITDLLDKQAIVNPKDFGNLEELTDEDLEDFVRTNSRGVPMRFPLVLRKQEKGAKDWLVPQEPMISLSGQHNIIRRSMSKGDIRGTIKERWTQDDYTIQVEGVLIGDDGKYPEEEVARLRDHLTFGALFAQSPILEMFEIGRIVVSSWSIPFTSGNSNQNFSFTAYSDNAISLFEQ